MIAIIDYDMGNLRSVEKAFEAAGHRAVITRQRQVIADASHVVLPGVGAFGDCMRNLESYDLIDPIRQSIASGKPFLGICLGMQLLFTESEEFGSHKGLNVFPGKVVRFRSEQTEADREALKIPHMGWNAIHMKKTSKLLEGLGEDSYMYFVHSYYVAPEQEDVVCTATEYGGSFVSSIERDNIFGCQFHPEKSQAGGLTMLKNFGAL
jgi:imidazole glycerol-phosphate synthase subunit HisH